METGGNARREGFFEGIDWAIDNLLLMTFVAGIACGASLTAILMGLILLL